MDLVLLEELMINDIVPGPEPKNPPLKGTEHGDLNSDPVALPRKGLLIIFSAIH